MLSENTITVKWNDCFGYAYAMKQCLSFVHVLSCSTYRTGTVLKVEKFWNLSGFFQSGRRREILIVLIGSGKKCQTKSTILAIKFFRDPVPTYMNAADHTVWNALAGSVRSRWPAHRQGIRVKAIWTSRTTPSLLTSKCQTSPWVGNFHSFLCAR